MATQGLNFQTHQFNDPTEGLQKALGAGSMFAQSLKSMQDFESEQAKLRMMQQEKDRQAKIDFEASQEKAKNIAASAALNDKSVKMDFGNEMYRGVTDQEKNAMVAKSDAELGIKSLSYADMFKGADTSKWDKDQLAERDQLLAADSDKTAKYTAGNKLAVQKRLNMLSGMGNDEAEKAAAAALGLKEDQAKSILAGDTLQETFGQRVLETANSPLYMQSDAQALRDFKKKYGTTAQIEASIGSADKAESMARKELHDQIALKQQQIQAGISKADEAVLNREIQMMQLQMQNIGSPLERASYKESSGGGSKGKTVDQEYSDALRGFLAKYNGAPVPLRDEAVSLAETMRRDGKSPNQIATALEDSMSITRGKGSDEDKYAFKVSSLANVTADADYMKRKLGEASGSSEISYYAQAMQDKQAVIDKINALQGKKGKGAAGEVAVLQKQLAELERTPMQSAKDAAYQAGLDFAKDFNIGKYGDKQAAAATLQQTLANGGSENGQPIKDGPAKAVTPEWSSKVKAFQLPAGYTALKDNRPAQDKMLADTAVALIKKEEGNGKNGKRYEPYPDMVKQKGGGEKNMGMVLGHGVKVSEFQGEALGGKTYNPKNAEHRAIFDRYEEKRILDLVPLARKQAASLGLPAEAVPVLASMNHQLGKGWMSDFKGTVQNIKDGQYDVAIQRIADSKWNRVQTPERAQKFINVLGAVRDMKAQGAKWFDDDAHKANPKYDSSLYEMQKKIVSDNEYGRKAMLDALVQNKSVASSTDFISKPDQAAINSYQFDKSKSDAIKDNADKIFDEYQTYSAQHKVKESARLKQLSASGKAPEQIDLIERTGMTSMYAAAKTPKDRLEQIAKAQMIEAANLTEVSKNATTDLQRQNIYDEATRRNQNRDLALLKMLLGQ